MKIKAFQIATDLLRYRFNTSEHSQKYIQRLHKNLPQISS